MNLKEPAPYIDYSVLKPELCNPYAEGTAGEYDKVTKDLKACVEAVHKYGREIKVILETDVLNEEQIRKKDEVDDEL
nr:hypothetical protein [uncultured Anaerostipes sp.]